MAINSEEYINKMYDSSLASQKETLQQNYDQVASDLEAEKQKQQKAADANLTRTYVEANKAAKNYNEVQNAYGLTSGAMAQARLAQDNQLQGDLTAIRAAQQSVDADIERQRTLLGQQYASAIAKAQADNDLQRAQALYAAAKADEDRLLQQQKEAGNLMAGVGDYSILANLYGLTPEQLALLQKGSSGYGGSYSYPRPTNPDDDTGGDETYDVASILQQITSRLPYITPAKGSDRFSFLIPHAAQVAAGPEEQKKINAPTAPNLGPHNDAFNPNRIQPF